MAIFTVAMTGDKALIARMAVMPDKVRTALRRTIRILAIKLERHVTQDKLTGQVLNVRTGNLRRSIFNEVKDDGNKLVGIVGSSGDVRYARIHEFGGRTKPHVITATKAKALQFMMNGKMSYFKSVNHPGSVMPERSYLRSSLTDMQDEIITAMTETVAKALKT